MDLSNLNIRLTAAVILLSILSFFINDPLGVLEKNYESSENLISHYNPDDIISIELSQANLVFYTLQKKENNWILHTKNSKQFPADSTKINLLLKKISSLKKYRDITSNKERFTEFGLSEDSLKLVLSTAEGKTAIIIGKQGATLNTSLVRIMGEDTVYSVRSNLKRNWNQIPDYFRIKKLAKFTPENISSVKVENQKNTYELSSNIDGNWVLTLKRNSTPANASNVERFLKGLTYVEGDSFYDGKSTGKTVALITLTFKGNVTEIVEFRKVHKDLYLVKSTMNPYWQQIGKNKIDGLVAPYNEFKVPKK